MALANFTLPFGAVASANAPNWGATISPIQHHATAVNNLLYSPEGHQKTDSLPNDSPYYKNDPYAPPAQSTNLHQQYRHRQHHHYQFRSRTNNNYLPPPLPPPSQQLPEQKHPVDQFQPISPPLQSEPPIQPQQQSNQPTQTITSNFQQQTQQQSTRTYGESSYQQENQFYRDDSFNSSSNDSTDEFISQPIAYDQTPTPHPQISNENLASTANVNDVNGANNYPENRPTYTRVQAGQGSKTQVHAVLDYDNDEYYDEENTTGMCQ